MCCLVKAVLVDPFNFDADPDPDPGSALGKNLHPDPGHFLKIC